MTDKRPTGSLLFTTAFSPPGRRRGGAGFPQAAAASPPPPHPRGGRSPPVAAVRGGGLAGRQWGGGGYPPHRHHPGASPRGGGRGALGQVWRGGASSYWGRVTVATAGRGDGPGCRRRRCQCRRTGLYWVFIVHPRQSLPRAGDPAATGLPGGPGPGGWALSVHRCRRCRRGCSCPLWWWWWRGGRQGPVPCGSVRGGAPTEGARLWRAAGGGSEDRANFPHRCRFLRRWRRSRHGGEGGHVVIGGSSSRHVGSHGTRSERRESGRRGGAAAVAAPPLPFLPPHPLPPPLPPLSHPAVIPGRHPRPRWRPWRLPVRECSRGHGGLPSPSTGPTRRVPSFRHALRVGTGGGGCGGRALRQLLGGVVGVWGRGGRWRRRGQGWAREELASRLRGAQRRHHPGGGGARQKCSGLGRGCAAAAAASARRPHLVRG